jgi:internalin A
VQINQPEGLATALDGTVFFADTGNNLLRGYVPESGHVIEVGGLIVSGTPEGGFNGDQQAAQQTEFRAPFDIATTGTGQLAVADRGNGRVRQFAR